MDKDKKIKTFIKTAIHKYLNEDMDINAMHRAMKQREYDADQERKREQEKYDSAKEPNEILEKIIHNSSFLRKYENKLTVRKEYIMYDNNWVTEKYIRIFYDYNSSSNKIRLAASFNGNISDDAYKMSIWKKYMTTAYVRPQYGGQDTKIEIYLPINSEAKIGEFIEDIVKSYILQGW